MLTVGSLFSGIGGLELGLERTNGFKVKWQCEINPYAYQILEKHWPDVKRYKDVKEINEKNKPEPLVKMVKLYPSYYNFLFWEY